ncbi:bifunctional riboflavin kinase/FAD synthetase [Parabacteroides sp. PF5-6]|uniref:bifunctional riboflavin kinase/FAD synthetase n=1 Tax=Parabacteroides sp. PF5-6 TaxID=1742403 RepID=UPI002405FD65|nr:bifunctional riboflavin kinase/FAD synthetase [Parabacteroides sp. PF5-6]MDF9830888.1 riboflavin kinase/FMN adenylyltransferase [Parabacteroides sp. PF5-6]
MVIIRDTKELDGMDLIVTVGFFDGVHLGHRFLIDQMKEAGERLSLATAVITFPQHPRKVLQQDYQPKLLNSFEEKLKHLEETGIDYCIVLDFTPELSRLRAKEFIHRVLARDLHVKTLLVGYDHRFGYDRADGIEQYIAYGRECGMEVIRANPYTAENLHVSSSEVRRLLAEGRVDEAAELLTYRYQIRGTIVAGFKVGRKLGFPTANIQLDEPFKIIPAIGVYAVRVYLKGKSYAGMLYIGNRPTLNNGENITLEVNIFDFSEDIYNEEISVAFVRYVRGDIRFDSVEELKEQLAEDRRIIMNYKL